MNSKLVKPLITTALLWVIRDAICANAARKPKLENGLNCTNHLQIIDRCSSLATYSYTTSFNQYPLNAKEMKASCDRISEGLKCVKIYTKCLSSLSRRSLTSYATARSKHSKRICANLNDQGALDFVKSAECINKNKVKKERMVANERELIASLQFLSVKSSLKWEQRFHKACCSAADYKLKSLKDTEPECTSFRPVVEDMLNSMVGELIDNVCPDEKSLNVICPKLPKINLAKEWKAVSLTSAALDLIVALADNPEDK